MQLLRQSTVTTVYVGPVLDSSGAAVTTAVVGDFRLVKNGTAATLSGATVTHDANGYYTIALTTGNVDTLGRLTLAVGNTAQSMSTHRYSVLPASVFDALITNASNATGGLVTATGAISSMAGAISTLTAPNVRTELATELGRIDAAVSSRMATYTQPTGFLAAIFPGAVASPTNITAASGVTLAATTHTGAVIPTVTDVTNRVSANTDRLAGQTVTASGGVSFPGSVANDSTTAKEATLTNRPTLAQIEASTVLAKESSVAAVLTAIQNLNNLSAKMNIYGAPLLEIPESGSTIYAFTVVVRDDEDKLVNLDVSPTLAAANAAGTSRSGNLSAVANPSTGRYTFTYTVANTHPAESLRVTVSGTTSSEARYIEWIGAVVNYDTLSVLQQIQTDLSGKPTLAQIEGSTVLAKEATVTGRPTLTQIEASTILAKKADVPTANQNRDAVLNALPGAGYVDGSFGDRLLISDNDNRTVKVTGAGSGHIGADVHNMQPNVVTASALAADAVTEIQAGLATASALTTVGNNVSALLARIPATLFQGITYLSRWLGAMAGKTADSATRAEINATPAGASYNETTDSLEAVRDRGDEAWLTGQSQGTGNGARTVTITVRDPSTSPVEAAVVRVSRTGETFVGTTNTSGVVTFSLNDAAWTVSITANGYSFTPASLSVVGNVTQTYTLTTAGGGVTPSTPPMTTGYWVVYSELGQVQAGAQVTLVASSPPVGSTGVVMDDTPRTATADGNGIVQFGSLIRGATYIAYRTGSNRKFNVLVPANAGTTAALGSIVG